MSYWTNKFDGEVAGLLKNGAVGLMPSDTIYGLSGRALDQKTVERIYELKGRDQNKPFIVLISDLKMLDSLNVRYNKVITDRGYWPGPLTVIFPAPQAPDWLHIGTKTLAIRLPDNKQLLKLINQTGPLISTSANLQSQEPLTSASEAKAIFGERLDFYVDVGVRKSLPSTITKIENGKLKVVRQGFIKI